MVECLWWVKHILVVLLGLRPSLKGDLWCMTAELVYGAPLRFAANLLRPLTTAQLYNVSITSVNSVTSFAHFIRLYHANRNIFISPDHAFWTRFPFSWSGEVAPKCRLWDSFHLSHAVLRLLRPPLMIPPTWPLLTESCQHTWMYFFPLLPWMPVSLSHKHHLHLKLPYLPHTR